MPQVTERSEIERQIDAIVPAGCKVLTTKELALVTGIKIQTLKSWRSAKNGGPNFVKLGGSVRYPREAVIDWMLRNAVEIVRARIAG